MRSNRARLIGWDKKGEDVAQENCDSDFIVSRCRFCMLVKGGFCGECKAFVEANPITLEIPNVCSGCIVKGEEERRIMKGGEGQGKEMVNRKLGNGEERCICTRSGELSNNIEEEQSRLKEDGAMQAFPTKRRVIRRSLKEAEEAGDEAIREWAVNQKFTIGPALPVDKRILIYRLLWTYRHLGIEELNQLPQTDLLTARVRLKPGAVPYAMKGHRRLAPRQMEFFQKTIMEGLECGMYEKTPVDEEFSPWSAHPVIVHKVPEDPNSELRLTFDYHFIEEEMPATAVVLPSEVQDAMSSGGSQRDTFGKADLKNGYWAIGVERESRKILAFRVPGIGQVRPTRMPQGLGSSAFVFHELGYIAFGAIPGPNPEPSLLGMKEFRVYVDDMFWRMEGWKQQYEFLRDHLLPRLDWAMLRLAWKKLVLFMLQITCLGIDCHPGGAQRIRPERTQKILDWPAPLDASGVRQFLGSVQICRRWIKNFTELARPLTRLGGKLDWRWTMVEEVSFRIIKNKCATVVAMFTVEPNEEWPLHAYFDASGYGVGFALLQLVEGVERPLIYDSIALNKAERNYGTYKRELVSMVKFTRKYGHHFQTPGRVTIFYTDHKPLVTFLNSHKLEGIYARWAMVLKPHNIEIKYIEGTRNRIADGLSRTIFPGEEPVVMEEIAEEVLKRENEVDWFWKDGKGGFDELVKEILAKRGNLTPKEQEVLNMLGKDAYDTTTPAIKGRKSTITHKDKGEMKNEGSGNNGHVEEEDMGPVCYSRSSGIVDSDHLNEVMMDWVEDDWYGAIVLCLMKGGQVPKHIRTTTEIATFRERVSRFRFGIAGLVREVGGEFRNCVREQDVRQVLYEAHDRSGHFASGQMLNTLRRRVWWKNMASDIRKYVDGCITCARYGPAIRSHELHPTLTYQPFDMLGIDFIGPLPISDEGFKYILHIIDYFSRYTAAWATKSNSSVEAVDCLKDFCLHYQIPIVVYHDPGTHFEAQLFKDFCKQKSIVSISSPSGASKSTGMIERANRILEDCLKKRASMDGVNSWPKHLKEATRDVNTRVMTRMGYTPFEILYGLEPRLQYETALYPSTRTKAIQSAATELGARIYSEFQSKMNRLLLDRTVQMNDGREEVRRTQIAMNSAMKKKYDRGVKGWTFEAGDLVMLWDTTVNKGLGEKMSVQWPGPFVVKELTAGGHGVSYWLCHLNGTTIPGAFHGDHLKLFQPRTGYLQNYEKDPVIPPKAIRKLRKRGRRNVGIEMGRL